MVSQSSWQGDEVYAKSLECQRRKNGQCSMYYQIPDSENSVLHIATICPPANPAHSNRCHTLQTSRKTDHDPNLYKNLVKLRDPHAFVYSWHWLIRDWLSQKFAEWLPSEARVVLKKPFLRNNFSNMGIVSSEPLSQFLCIVLIAAGPYLEDVMHKRNVMACMFLFIRSDLNSKCASCR